jgi:hypothetical protein
MTLFGFTLVLLPILFILWVIAAVRGGLRARRGIVALRGLLRRNRGFCPRCGYCLRGNVSGICPECGTDVPARLI